MINLENENPHITHTNMPDSDIICQKISNTMVHFLYIDMRINTTLCHKIVESQSSKFIENSKNTLNGMYINGLDRFKYLANNYRTSCNFLSAKKSWIITYHFSATYHSQRYREKKNLLRSGKTCSRFWPHARLSKSPPAATVLTHKKLAKTSSINRTVYPVPWTCASVNFSVRLPRFLKWDT